MLDKGVLGLKISGILVTDAILKFHSVAMSGYLTFIVFTQQFHVFSYFENELNSSVLGAQGI